MECNWHPNIGILISLISNELANGAEIQLEEQRVQGSMGMVFKWTFIYER